MSNIINPLTGRIISTNSKIYKLLTNDTIFKNEDNILIPLNKKMYFYDESRGHWLHNKFKKTTKPKKSKTESPVKPKKSKKESSLKPEMFLLENFKPEPEPEVKKKSKKKEKPLLLKRQAPKFRRYGRMSDYDKARYFGFRDDTEMRKYYDRQRILKRRLESLRNNPKLIEELKQFFIKRKRLFLDYKNNKKFTKEELEKRNFDLWDELLNKWVYYDDKLIYDDLIFIFSVWGEFVNTEDPRIKYHNDIINRHLKKNNITWNPRQHNKYSNPTKEEKTEATKNKMLPEDFIIFKRWLKDKFYDFSYLKSKD